MPWSWQYLHSVLNIYSYEDALDKPNAVCLGSATLPTSSYKH